MTKEIVIVFFICLIIYNLSPQFANGSKVKLVKKLIKAKLLKSLKFGKTKIIIPFIVPIPIKKKFPMFMTAMPLNNYPNGGYDSGFNGFNGFNSGYDNRFNGLNGGYDNRFNGLNGFNNFNNNIDYNNAMLYQQPLV